MIVNADASQVYRDLRILSARPDAADEAEIAHRLFGHVDGAVAWSAALWAAEARAAVAAVHAGGGLPILVGGSGLYIRTLLDGIAPVPPVDEATRAAVRAMPVAAARAALEAEDAAAARHLGPRDASRIARALEVIRATGRSILDWRREPRAGGIAGGVALAPMVIDPPSQALYARCDARVAAMLAAGAIEEVAALTARGLDPALPVMRAIGVGPLADHLSGRASLAEARDRIARDTRRYAKRQKTWNRHQMPPHWPRVPASDMSHIHS